MRWVDDGTVSGATYVREDGGQSHEEQWALEYFRYMVIPPGGPTWKLTDFDFDLDYKRFSTGVQESLLSADNPELRKFKAAGGKLIIYQGWSDESVPPERTIDFYNTVTRTMGGLAATQGFFRLFMVPGMGHCTGEDGPFAIDYLSYMEKWVEQGRTPDVLIGAHVQGISRGNVFTLKFPLDPAVSVSYTRPVYPYPLRAKYKGAGDQNDAKNFTAVESR
jgi:feruloyl esterase